MKGPEYKSRGANRWDWSTVVFIALIIVIAMVFSFALWAPHPFPHH